MLSCFSDETEAPASNDDAEAMDVYDAVAENFVAEIRDGLRHQVTQHRFPAQKLESH